ncbi:hypothetical protein QBC32DRAFT_388759, partial [Pseudoneurospora amorphoporcata]
SFTAPGYASIAPEQVGTKQKDKSPFGSSWSIAYIARAFIYRFLLLTFDCSDVQPLLALFFWPGHIVALVLLLLDVYCRRIPLIGRLSTDSPKPIHGKLRTGIQLDLDPVFLLSLLCSYWVKLLETMLKSAMAETKCANDDLPIDNPTPSNEEDEKEKCPYTGDEIDLVLKTRQVASENGHTVVGICRWVESMNAKDPLWEQNWRTNRPLPACVSGGCGLGYYDRCESMHLAMSAPSDFDPRKLPTGRSGPSSPSSMAVNHPRDYVIDDFKGPDVSAPSGEDQKESSNVKSARNEVINGFLPIPDNCDAHLYPAEVEQQRKHQRRPQVEQQEIPATYMALTAQGPAPDTYSSTSSFPSNTRSWLNSICNRCGSKRPGCCAFSREAATRAPSTCKSKGVNEKPIDQFAGMSKRTREDIEILLAAVRRMPLSAYMPYVNSNASMPLTPEKKASKSSGDGGGAPSDVAPGIEGWEPITSALDPDVERPSSVVTTRGSVSDSEPAKSVASGSEIGKDEKDERDGNDGKNGEEIEESEEVEKVENVGKNGNDGENGKEGQDGENGVSVVVGEAPTL